MTIKLIACDLDGTLIGHTLTFSPRVLQAIRQARQQGIAVTLATGRGFPATQRFASQLDISVPLVCYQGAQIKTPNGETLYEATLPQQHLPRVEAFCRKHGWELTVYCHDEIYQTTRLYEQDYYDRWFGLPTHKVEDLSSSLPGKPIKFIALAPSKEQGDHLEQEIRQLATGCFQVLRSHAWFVEGLAIGVSKGNSLARLADSWNITREQVMALGDSGNDISMLKWAGLGIAMGNAPDHVKAVADQIAPEQSQDGAAWAMEKYALCL